jgi:aspartyl-tRNA(Asn)/glutamyl-tRNA(Gln) amidotransferase subunit A
VRAVRSGRLTPLEVVEAHIARITKVNPLLNAVAAARFTAAREEARAAAARPRSAWGPLHGLPVTIKDALDVAGMPATCGLASRADRVAPADATVVARLRRATVVGLCAPHLEHPAMGKPGRVACSSSAGWLQWAGYAGGSAIGGSPWRRGDAPDRWPGRAAGAYAPCGCS